MTRTREPRALTSSLSDRTTSRGARSSDSPATGLVCTSDGWAAAGAAATITSRSAAAVVAHRGREPNPIGYRCRARARERAFARRRALARFFARLDFFFAFGLGGAGSAASPFGQIPGGHTHTIECGL